MSTAPRTCASQSILTNCTNLLVECHGVEIDGTNTHMWHTLPMCITIANVMVLSLFGTVGDDKSLDSANSFFTFLYAVEIGAHYFWPSFACPTFRMCIFFLVLSAGATNSGRYEAPRFVRVSACLLQVQRCLHYVQGGSSAPVQTRSTSFSWWQQLSRRS